MSPPHSNDIVFVAHEFGLYQGHGGIASYLYNICKYILDNTQFKVHVIADQYDHSCDLLASPRFRIHKIAGDIHTMRKDTLDICSHLNPAYVEFADFQAFGLDCVLSKFAGQRLLRSVLVTNCHTATKEIYEWNNEKYIHTAPSHLISLYHSEMTQIQLCDYCIAPSSFLAKYVKKSYHLTKEVLVFANPYLKSVKTKTEIREDLESEIDFSEFERSFNIVLISRFEGRKRQKELVKVVQEMMRDGNDTIKLILAGNTSFDYSTGANYRRELFDIIDDRFKDSFLIYDFLDLREQEKFVAIADLTIMPSSFENQPVAMIEAVLRGVPVLASRYSGCADYTPTADLIFDPFCDGDLKLKIETFLRKSEAERAEIARMQKRNLLNFIAPQSSIMGRLNLPLPHSECTLGKLKLQDLYSDE